MTLTKRTFLTVVSTFIALFFILATLSDIILLRSFAELERIVVINDVQKVRKKLEMTYDELARSLSELQENSPAISPEVLESLPRTFLKSRQIDSLFILSSDNRIIADRHADPSNVKRGAGIYKQLIEYIVTYNSTNPELPIRGLVIISDTPVQVVAESLPGSNHILIACRFLDDKETSKIAAQTGLSLEIAAVNDEGDTQDITAALTEFNRGISTPVLVSAGEDIVRGYSFFKDISGTQVCFARITEERQFYKHGTASIIYMLSSLVIVGIVFCGVMLFFIRETVLKHLEQMTKKVCFVTSQGDISERLTIDNKNDELDNLALSINSMLDSLEHAENNLRESEERYRLLFDRAPDAIFIIGVDGDEAGNIVAANQVASELHGYTPEELLQLKISDLNTAESNKSVDALSAEILSSSWITAELWHRKKDGTTFPVEIHAGLVKIKGKRYVLGFDRDITQRKIAEESDQMYLEQIKLLNDELKRKAQDLATVNNELEAFNYTVSHDMRGPLTRISGYCQILMEDDLLRDASAREYIARIHESEIWLNEMIDSLLNLATVTRTELDMQPVDLSAIAESLLSELVLSTPERIVRARIEPDLVVTGDARLLRTVITNLIENAWKYSCYKDEAVIEFGAEQTESGTVYFVRDNGAGFQGKDADKLFRVFTRLHDSSEFNGTGIGLATVQRIIMRHGGRIWADATPGEGATFYFSLP